MAFTNYSFSPIGVGNVAPASSSYSKPKAAPVVYGPAIPSNVKSSSSSNTSSASTSKSSGSSSSNKSPSSSNKYSSSNSKSSGSAKSSLQDQINSQINSYYSAAMDRINSQESALKNSEQDYYNIATTPYTSQVPLVQQAATQGQNAIVAQQDQAKMQEQNALASARQLYDELNARNIQGFGSAALGSVGQAASEVLGRTAQQNFGNIRNQAGTTLQNLYTAARDLTDKTNAQLQQLDLQKNQALSQAKLWFRERLDAINQMKEQTQQFKAQAKIDELKSYRDYVRNLSSQADALKSQIALSAQANGQNISEQIQNFQNAGFNLVSSGNDSLDNYNGLITTSMGNFGMGNSINGSSGNTGDITSQLYGKYEPSYTNKKSLFDNYSNMA